MKYSVKSLLCVLLIASAAFGYWRHSYDSCVRPLTALRNGGATVISEPRGLWRLISLPHAWRPAEVVYIEKAGKITTLDIDAINECVRLESIHLCDSGFNDDWARQIDRHPYVLYMDVSNTSLSDNGLSLMCMSCPNVGCISIAHTGVTSHGLRSLELLGSLRRVCLDGHQIDSSAAKYLAGVRCLNTVELRGENVNMATLTYLSACPNIRTIYVGHGCSITSGDIAGADVRGQQIICK